MKCDQSKQLKERLIDSPHSEVIDDLYLSLFTAVTDELPGLISWYINRAHLAHRELQKNRGMLRDKLTNYILNL